MEFPVLAFSRESVHLISTANELTRTTRLALRTGYFENLKLADHSGEFARVVDVKEIRRLPPGSFGDFMGWLGADPKYEISFELEQLPSISLPEAKQLICRCFEDERESWEEMMDLENFEQAVKGAESFDKLFAVFREFNV